VTVRLGRIEGQEVAGLGEMSHLVLSTDLRALNQQKMLVRFLSTIGSQFAQKRKETQALTYILRLPVKIMQSGRAQTGVVAFSLEGNTANTVLRALGALSSLNVHVSFASLQLPEPVSAQQYLAPLLCSELGPPCSLRSGDFLPSSQTHPMTLTPGHTVNICECRKCSVDSRQLFCY